MEKAAGLGAAGSWWRVRKREQLDLAAVRQRQIDLPGLPRLAVVLGQHAQHGQVVIERRPPVLPMGRAVLLPPPGAFLQATRAGEEALARLHEQPFDLVLLDVHMPVMDGTETIRAIRASGQPWANLPVIALTADAMTGDKERYLGMGMDGYMSKPIAERDLITEISRVRSLAPEQLAQNRQLKMVDAEDLAA